MCYLLYTVKSWQGKLICIIFQQDEQLLTLDLKILVSGLLLLLGYNVIIEAIIYFVFHK